MRLLAALLLLALLVVGGFLANRSLPTPSGAPTATATRAPTVDARGSAAFDRKVGDFRSQLARPSGQTVQLELTQDEVNAKLSDLLSSPSGGAPVRNLSVKLEEGQAVVTGTASIAGQEVPVEARLKAGASGGLLDLEVISVKAAGIPVPDGVRDQLVQQAETAIGGKDLNGLDVGFYLKSVRLTDEKVTIEGQTR
jgi:hypothetical protein